MSIIKDVVTTSLSYFYSYRVANRLRRVANQIYSRSLQRTFAFAGRKMYIEYPANILGFKHIRVGDNFSAFGRLRLEAYDRHLDNSYAPSITIGDNVSINYDCHIGCVNQIVIGNNVLMASKIFISDHSHGEITQNALKTPPSMRQVISKGPVIIEDNVWIGEGVAIMSNVTIGRNTIIGANSVVTSSIPANAVAAGIPAKVIKLLGE